jgi:hypothetical protein
MGCMPTQVFLVASDQDADICRRSQEDMDIILSKANRIDFVVDSTGAMDDYDFQIMDVDN